MHVNTATVLNLKENEKKTKTEKIKKRKTIESFNHLSFTFKKCREESSNYYTHLFTWDTFVKIKK